MRTGRLIVLALLVIGLAAFVYFFERHQPTTSEVEERANRVFPNLSASEVRGVVVQNEHGSFRFVKDGDSWTITEPISYPAESSAVRTLVSSLESLDVERRLDAEETDPSAYGLEEASRRVVLESADGTTRTLTIGEEAALGSNRAVTTNGSEILLVAKWFASNVDKKLEDWRSRDVIDIAASQVAAMEVQSGSMTVEIARDSGQWRLLEPVADLADREHVEGLISDLNALRVQEFVEEETAGAELGLEDPRYRVEVVRREGSQPVVLEFGATKKTEDQQTLVACRRDGTDVLWVNSRAETSLARPPARWRSQVVWSFDSWDAEKVTFESGDLAVAVERKDGAWHCGDGPADGSAMLDRLSLLSELQVVGFDLTISQDPQMGAVTVVLGEEDGAREVRMEFFEPADNDNHALVTVNERDTVMTVDGSAVRDVFDDLESLCDPPMPSGAASENESTD